MYAVYSYRDGFGGVVFETNSLRQAVQMAESFVTASAELAMYLAEAKVVNTETNAAIEFGPGRFWLKQNARRKSNHTGD